jgi:hypothetical protein
MPRLRCWNIRNLHFTVKCLILFILFLGSSVFGQIINPNTMMTNNWITAGVRGGIIARANTIDATQSPYNADKTGVTDATSAIQSAINAAAGGGAVYLPDGTYKIGSVLQIYENNVTLRGDTNSVLMFSGSGYLTVGNSGDEAGNHTDYIYAGSTNGSTNVILTAPPSMYIQVGDLVGITHEDILTASTNWEIINVHQGDFNIEQQEIITAVNGTNITLSDPLVYNFTNTPVIETFVGNVYHGIGVENLIFNTTNTENPFTIVTFGTYDSWYTNCTLIAPWSYAWYFQYNDHLTVFQNSILYGHSGSNHAGWAIYDTSEGLFANNIFASGLQPAIEFDNRTSANVFFANFITNCTIDIDNHGPHSIYNLWEENVCGGYFEMDGYFGSASHQTVLRNCIQGTNLTFHFSCPLVLNRWARFMNVVGNVLGVSGYPYPYYQSYDNNQGASIMRVGFPEIGGGTYVGQSPPMAWNYPSGTYPNGNADNFIYTDPILTFSGSQGPTTTLTGNFSQIPAGMANLPGVYSVVVQDNNNTNLYYPTNNTVLYPTAAGTSSSLTLNENVTVASGMKFYVSGQNSYQQLQTNDILTDTISGNYDYYNNSITWNTNPSTTIPISEVYSSEPSWWGTNRWPAIDPQASPVVTVIPAELAYIYGWNNSGGTGSTTPAAPLTFVNQLIIR